jgi:predicted DNA-binding transcriptional regulator AlpA
MVEPPVRLMLAEEVAPMVGMAPSTLSEHCRRGHFPHRKLPYTRRLLFVPEHVVAWIEGCDRWEVRDLAGGGRVVAPKKLGRHRSSQGDRLHAP